MAAGTTGNNSVSSSDSDSTSFSSMSDQVDFDGLPKNFIKYFKEASKLVDEMVDKWSKAIKDTEAATGKAAAGRPGAGRLGLGEFTRAEKIGLGLGVATAGAGVYMSMAPNTMAAVTQRMGADTYAGLSGMSSRQAILQANSQVRGGATSAMGPTMAAMNLMYQGGYTASSLSSKNIMGQLGGLSAMSGMSNEQAAGSMASMNGMSFLRAGIQIRDRQGNLKPPNQIINDVYSFLYRGQTITKQQAALVLNPGSKGYATIQQITGGDAQLMQMIQSGILARASNGKPLTASQMSDPNKVLNAMGVDQSSPIRANFRYNSSENKKLASTEQGLVGGYDASLRTAASLNDAYSKMADILGPVNDGLMTLKGILQTFPNAGGMGGTVSGIASGAVGIGKSILEYKMISKLMGGSGGLGLKGLAGGALEAGGLAGGLKMLGGSMLKGGLIAGGSMIAGNLIKGNSSKGSFRSRAGNAAKWAGIMAAIPVLGETILPELIAGGIGYATGGPSDHGNLGVGGPATSSMAFSSPVPKATPITSPFGPRDNSAHPGISANHKGIDFGTPVGTALTAVTNGTISTIGNDMKGYGNWIEVKHDDGTASRYGHLSQIGVSRGQKVGPGQVVGRSGGKAGAAGAGNSTGPHLHFEILDQKGVKVNPAPYLSGAPAGPISSGGVTASAVAGPRVISGQSMSAAKSATSGITRGLQSSKSISALTSPSLSSTLTNSSYNEDFGGPSGDMNIGTSVGSRGTGGKTANIYVTMKVNIALGSVQEAQRLVKEFGKQLTSGKVLDALGKAL